MPYLGKTAPDFSLPDKDNKKISLKSFRGKWVVLYFYPKDNTSGCTLEALDFGNRLKSFKKLDAVILGVSPDSPESHCRFIEKKELKVTLLSDPDHKVLKKYGVWQLKKLYGREYYGVVRSTFIIDTKGKIAYVKEKVKVKGHVEEIEGKVRELRKSG